MKSEIFKPEFIPFYMEEYIKYNLSPMEGLLYGFIRFYCKRGMSFFYTSEQLAEILATSRGTIDNTIRSLKNKNVINTLTKGLGKQSIRQVFLVSSNDETAVSSNDASRLIKGGDKREEEKEDINIVSKDTIEKPFFENEKINLAFLEFIENRKQMKKRMTKLAIEKTKAKIEKWILEYDEKIIVSFINTAIERNYQGIFETFPLSKNKEKLAYETADRNNFTF